LYDFTAFNKVLAIPGFSGRGGLFPSNIRVLNQTINTLDLIVSTVARQGFNDFYNISPVRILRNMSTGVYSY
jgi:hypothetical protein